MNFSNQNENYYDILGVSSTASIEEIKKAYRKLSLELHPDRHNNNPTKAEKYKKVTAAYNILSNSSEKKNYDELNLNNPETMFMNMMLNPMDIMNMLKEIKKYKGPLSDELFSNFTSNSPFYGSPFNINNFDFNSKPKTISKNLSITLLDTYRGCQMPLLIKRWLFEDNIKSEQEETIYINIPPGIDNNEIITIKEKGNRLSNINRGDIEVKIIIINNTNFIREGLDLIYKKTISLKESLCGFSFDITYIDERQYKITNAAGNIIPSNYKKIIPELGMMRDNIKGDLYIIFDIIYPKKIDLEQIKKLESIL